MGILSNLLKNGAEMGHTALRWSIPGVLDDMVGSIFGQGIKGATGAVSGVWGGLTGRGLNLTNTSGLGKLTKVLGYGAGSAAVGVTKPIAWAGKNIIKNTPGDIARVGNLGKGIFGLGFKKTGSTGANAIFGYEARALTPWAITAGALAYGAADSAGEERFNLGLRTAINGVMDTDGVSLTPGSINPSYTPVYNKLNDHGATGELPLALHRRRNSGLL